MDDPQDDTPQHAPTEILGDEDTELTRRALFGTVFGGVAVVAGLKTVENRFTSSADRHERLAVQNQQVDGTPGASPVASPVASPAASPEPTPTGPEMVGELLVERGESFAYGGTPVDGGELTMFISGDGEGINLSPPSFRHDFQISASYLDPLLWIDDQTMEPVPWLAERWEWDESGKVVTLFLRDDVTWHDGSPLRARDVTFSFNIYRDDLDSNVRNIFNQMESIAAIDDTTVEVRLLTPDANWLFNAATQLVFQRAQYREHWASKVAGERTLGDFLWGDVLPIGTGPWKVTSVSPDGVELVRNEAYFADAPYFQTLNLIATPSDEVRISRWNEGEGDILGQIEATQLPLLQATPGRLYASHGAQVMFAAFNFDNQTRVFPNLLSDVRIRRALSMAVDRQKYASGLFANMVQQMSAGTVAQPWAHNAQVVSPQRDLAGARRLLQESGLTDLNNDGLLEDFNGESLTFTIIVQDNAQQGLIQLLQGLTEDFRGIGANLIVNVLDPQTFATSWMQTRDYDMIAYAYPLYPGFTDFDLYGSNFDIRVNPQGWNPGGYSNEQVDDLIRQLLVTVDIEQQRGVLHSLQEIVNDDLFGMWFGFPDELVITREDIQGFQPNKYLSTWNTRLLWRGSGQVSGATPVGATPVASPAT